MDPCPLCEMTAFYPLLSAVWVAFPSLELWPFLLCSRCYVSGRHLRACDSPCGEVAVRCGPRADLYRGQEWGLWAGQLLTTSSAPGRQQPEPRVHAAAVLLCSLPGLLTGLVPERGPQASRTCAAKLCWEMQLAELTVVSPPPSLPKPQWLIILCPETTGISALSLLYLGRKSPPPGPCMGFCRVPGVTQGIAFSAVLRWERGRAVLPSWVQLMVWKDDQGRSTARLTAEILLGRGGWGGGLPPAMPVELRNTHVYLCGARGFVRTCCRGIRRAVKKSAAVLKLKKHGQLSWPGLFQHSLTLPSHSLAYSTWIAFIKQPKCIVCIEEESWGTHVCHCRIILLASRSNFQVVERFSFSIKLIVFKNVR